MRKLAKTILEDVEDYVTSKDMTQFDIEIIANVVRALLNHPDIVTDENYYTALGLLEKLSGADLYSHQPYDTNITNIIFEAYANAQLKIAHSYKVRKAQKENLLLGSGMNLFFYQNAYSLKTNPTEVKIDNSDRDYFLQDTNKTLQKSLIGGVRSPRKRNSAFSVNETLLYRDWSRRWDDTFAEFCNRVMYKMHPQLKSYTFRARPFELMLWHRLPSDINGTVFIRSKDAYWQFPPDMFTT